MADTIGNLAYRVKFDATALTQGLLSTRQQMTAARKITESMKSPLDRYMDGLTNLSNILARNTELEKHRITLENQLERAYLEEASAVRTLTKEEVRRLDTLKMAERVRTGVGAQSVASTAAAQARPDMAKIYREENRARGIAEQERLRRYTTLVDQESAAARKGLQDRLKIYKKEKAEREALLKQQTAAAEKAAAAETAARHRANAERGMAEKQRVARYTTMVDQETAAARKGLRDRLELYKQEKAARLEAMAAKATGPMEGPGFQDSNTFASGSGGGGSGGGIGGGFGFGMKAFAGAAVASSLLQAGSAAKEFVADSQAVFGANEMMSASFEVFTGSAAKTRILTDEMKKLSAISGVSLSALSSGASAMMSFGVTAEDVTGKMREMAAISRGDPERFKAMALAYGQVTAAGRLMGQENLQLINSGFAPLAEISRTTGRSMADLKKDMENGLITTKMVADAFTSATKEGGLFNGMLEKIGETTTGAQNKSKAAWDQAKNDVGEALAPLTRWRAEVSEFFAKDVSQLAGLFKSAPVPDPAAEAANTPEGKRKAREEEQRKRIADVRDREKKAQERMAAEQEAMRVSGMERLTDMQQGTNMDTIRQQSSAGDFQKFNNIIDLLDDATKKQATEDFANYRNLQNIYSYLDKTVAAELQKVEALREQNKQYAEMKAKSEELQSSADSLKDKYQSSADKLKEQLVELEVMRGRGMISNDVYDKARNDAATAATADSRQSIVQANTLPAAIAAGSQEAYKVMVQNQNRASTGKKSETEKQLALSKDQVTVARESRDLLKQLSEKLDLEAA